MTEQHPTQYALPERAPGVTRLKEYAIAEQDGEKVAIVCTSGEYGTFSRERFEAAVKAFFAEEF